MPEVIASGSIVPAASALIIAPNSRLESVLLPLRILVKPRESATSGAKAWREFDITSASSIMLFHWRDSSLSESGFMQRIALLGMMLVNARRKASSRCW